ncbi:MAG TPA: Holliday junction resolvase RuvX [Pyrinomonadaceae bacterium]
MPKDSTNETPDRFGRRARVPAGRLLALDLGEKRVGVAVSDELPLTARPLPYLRRTNWKQLLGAVADLLQDFDARALVIGLPLNLDGSEGEAAGNVRRLARNFSLSLHVPVFLQDERLTSREAEESLRAEGHSDESLRERIDSEAAAIILRDYLARFGAE